MPLAQTWSHGCIYMQGSLGAVVCHRASMYVPRQDLEDSNTEGKKGRWILTNTIRFADCVKYLADTYLTKARRALARKMKREKEVILKPKASSKGQVWVGCWSRGSFGEDTADTR